MSEEILLRRDEAESIAQEMKRASTDAMERFATTRSRLSELAESFRGAASTAFQSQFEQWDQGASQVVEALNDLGDWLNAATAALVDTDGTLASQLGS